MVHKLCVCKMYVFPTINNNKEFLVIHEGFHSHGHPAMIHIPEKDKKLLKESYEKNYGKSNMQLRVGNQLNDPFTNKHPTLVNPCWFRYEINDVNSQISAEKLVVPNNLEYFPKWKRDHQGWIVSSSIGNNNNNCGYIIMQNEWMKEKSSLIEELKHWETDSVEGIITNHSDTMHVCITSTHNNIIDRWIPVLISILWQKDIEHYKIHFNVLFSQLLHKTTELGHVNDPKSFIEQYPGNVSDMSGAIRIAFFSSLKESFCNFLKFQKKIYQIWNTCIASVQFILKEA